MEKNQSWNQIPINSLSCIQFLYEQIKRTLFKGEMRNEFESQVLNPNHADILRYVGVFKVY